MKIRRLIISLLLPLFVVAFSFSPGHSATSAGTPSLLEKVRKTEKAMDTRHLPKKCETPLNECQTATVERCSDDYEACQEQCTTEEVNDACDAKCKEELSLCEKDLPQDWKTIK